MDLGLENTVISGELFNQLYPECKFLKFTNRDDKEDYNFQIVTGHNEKTLNVNNNNGFAYGGIKFSFADNFIPYLNSSHDAFYYRYSRVPDDAQVYIEEKHFTTDRSLPGPDQSFSADPDEFSTLVREIRQGEQMLGSGLKRPVQEEIPLRKSGRRCLVATKDIAKGESITEANVGLKRPKAEPGLATDWYYQILGGRAARSIQKDEPIDWTAVRL